MKSKKLPKKNVSDFASKDEEANKSGAKLSKQKRSKKPSIYDDADGEFDDYDTFVNDNDEDFNNNYYDDDEEY